ncbi:MAG TPA: GntR family transcriptional regulator [Paraburkholderia sp.]|jgi:DNA-binding GntR family transcriptional regulator|uniref:GntR family transcriptional regulator n=1 Tax=Paraburkholderia sp. TaxID=1926495 RepID=UPI002B47D4D1|nr:GntR family transcriptional regulator [Paraburkholderia sp.]HKR43266.1 GntR family transcriptional regulator [Paraburkholderia sp.]
MDEDVGVSVAPETGEQSSVAEIVDWVARGIIEGRLRPGDDLNSVDLAKRFGVSRTPVREALFALTREGLVDWSPRRRPRVAAMQLKEVREIYALRALLYGQVSLAIVEHATEEDIAALWRAHGKLAEVAAKGDVDGYFWANVAFRDEELRVSRNGIFKEVLDSMRMRTNRLRHLSTSLPGRLQRSCTDHQRLCEAYAERDGVLAAALNRSIVMGALHAIEAAWDSLR